MAKAKSTKSKPAAKPRSTRSKVQPTFRDRVASVELPTDAYGLARPWRGLAVDERAAALLGLGYPRMLVAVDEPLVAGLDHAAYQRRYADVRVIPRALAPIRQAVEEADPPTAEQLESAVRDPKPRALADAVEHRIEYATPSLATLELRFGSTAVAEEVVKQLGALPVTAWRGEHRGLVNHGVFLFRQLAHLLWRVPVAVHARLRTQLVTLLERSRGEDGGLSRPGQSLDVILNGRAGVERHGRGFQGSIFTSELVYADDDPEWVAAQAVAKLAAQKPADRVEFDIQLAVVGGPKVLAALRASRDRFKKDQAKEIEAQLSLCGG